MTDEVAIPALLRAARGTYTAAIDERLTQAGVDDLPRHGAFVVGGMANRGGTAADVVSGLGISRQRTSQLVDTLVLRGYLARAATPGDRRRVALVLTERGRHVAREIRAAIDDVDEELARRVPPDQLAGLRAALIALADMTRNRS